MGTIGQRMAHPDSRLLEAAGVSGQRSAVALANADTVVENALGF